MSRLRVLICLSSLLFTVTMTPAWAQQPAVDRTMPGVVEVAVATAKVKVEAVNHAKRTATLRAEDGEVFNVTVPKSVVNFPQVQKGDTVTITYQVMTAFALEKASAAATSATPVEQQYGSVQVAPRGQKPAAVRTQVTQVTTTVEAVDYAKRKVTLRGPRGNTRTIDVSDQVQHLDQVKPGDRVVVRQTAAVAVSVTK